MDAEYGQLTQTATLQGVVIVLGGEGDPVPVHLQDGEHIHICRTKRDVAREMGHHLFGRPIRVEGKGRWFRDAMGDWQMKTFTIASFDVLDDSELSDVVAKLRSIQGKWKDQPDTTATLAALRGR